MKAEIAFALLALAASPAIAGQQFEFAIGYSKGTHTPPGIWWEQEFQTHNRVTGPSWSIGKSWTADNHWGLRADLGQLLKFSTRNTAVWDESTAGQVARGHLTCNPSTGEHCLCKFNGDGEAFGIHFGIFREFNVGRWQIQPEVGLLPYYYSWRMTVEHPNDATPTEIVGNATGSGIFITEYARLTVQRGMFFARLDYDHNVKGHSPIVGVQEGKIFTVSIGVAVPF